MDCGPYVLDLLGVLLALSAWICSLSTTLMSTWLTLATDLLPTESYEVGLWSTCVVHDLGGLECQPYNSVLGLPPDIKLARILMVSALCTGLLGLLVSIPGLDVVHGCYGRHLDALWSKRVLKGAGGICCLLAGILGLIPVSYIAHLTVIRFFDESVPDIVPRWEFGGALFCGWTAGVLHLVSGTMLLVSCVHRPGPTPPRGRRRIIRGRTDYV